MRIRKVDGHSISKSSSNEKLSHREIKHVDARAKDVQIISKKIISENRELLDKLKEY